MTCILYFYYLVVSPIVIAVVLILAARTLSKDVSEHEEDKP